jgi:hypothetical protein
VNPDATISTRRLLARALAAGSGGALARIPGARAAGAPPTASPPASGVPQPPPAIIMMLLLAHLDAVR